MISTSIPLLIRELVDKQSANQDSFVLPLPAASTKGRAAASEERRSGWDPYEIWRTRVRGFK